MSEAEQVDPNEPHRFEPWGFDRTIEGPPCKVCGLPQVAGPHLRWRAQQSASPS